MKKVYIIFLLLFFCTVHSFGQGILRGKITDENGETIIGASIVLKAKPSVGVITDFDGNYSLQINDTTPQGILISFISYKTVELTVHPVKGQVIVKDIQMVSSAKEVTSVEISAKAVKSRDYYVETMKRTSTTTLDYVSSETMKKTGDANVVAAVARVSGVSTNGGFITVRGIGDRYVKTAINGMRIPTLDPFTNNIKLDLFPASLIDNVIITKTASPDLPGDWAGAYLSVETKDYPDQLSINVESALGYNNQSTFKDVISSQRSKTDWLGYDNGFRDHNHDNFVTANMSPTQYQEFVALGLGPYYNSIGVNGSNWGEGTTTGDTYYKLGLVQLGLLAPAQFDDPVAFQNAKDAYNNGDYKNNAFNTINAGVPASGRSFPNNWDTAKRKAPLNYSQSFSVGNQIQLFNRPLGFLAGFRYSSAIQYDPNSTANRADVVGNGSGQLINTVSSAITQETSRETNGWSALFNLAYKLNPNNNLALLFMPNQTGVNNVRSSIDQQEPSNSVITKSQFYEQRKQMVYQLKSENYIPRFKTKIDLNASYTDGKSKAPDFKNLQYYKDPITNSYQIGGTIGDGIHRYYRYLSDNLFDSKISGEFPISSIPGLSRKIKVGAAYQRSDRKSDQYDYSVNFGPYNLLRLSNDDLNTLFDEKNFNIHTYVDNYGVSHSTIDEYYSLANSAANFTFGRSTVAGGFAMVDYSINSLIRLSGGLRVERAEIYTDVNKFDSLGYPKNDPRREYITGFPAANPGELNETDFLPSLNLIYKLQPDEEAPFNMRVNYSRTVARPSIRELSDVAVFDYEYRTFVFGNSNLRSVHVNNYDIRFEKYYKSGNNLSLSFFYKDFRNHIELVNSGGLSWQNTDQSKVMGVEVEGRKKLSRHFELRSNVTLIHSETSLVRTRLEVSNGIKNYIPTDTIDRPMFGQAPIVVNTTLAYTLDSLGLTISASYNVQGKRLVIASDKKEVPDIYEVARHLVDIKISKSLFKKFTASLTVRDLLNQPTRRAYNYTDGKKLDYDRFTYGTNFIFSLAYKL